MNWQRKFYWILCCLVFITGCKSAAENGSGETVYFCDAEQKDSLDNGLIVFQSDGHVFKSAETQTDDYSFDGKYSIKLDQTNQYGFSFILTDVKKDEFFQASVWEKDTTYSGALICVATGKTSFMLSSNDNDFYEHKKGWKKHYIQFKAITDLDSLTFFVFIGSDAPSTYFDHMEVKRFTERPNEMSDQFTAVELLLPDSSSQQIDSLIASAVQEDIIRDDFKDYVNGNWVYQNDTIPVEIRLKGDWTDHLVSGSPSYRVKIENDNAYNGLTTFSIQHPKTRNYLHEWFVHELFEHEGLLTTDYDFLQVKFNEQYGGVYAIEEHFEKQLLESRNRREGPILKMDESGFWALAVLAREYGLANIKAPFYQASINTCFKEKKTLKTESLSGQFKNGTILLDHFKHGFEHPDLLFDMKQLGTFYALLEIANVHHALAWHNRRFYYNPVTTKLEHIGYDMAPMVRPLNPLLASSQFNFDFDNNSAESCLDYMIFKNPEFRKYYTEKLKELSSIEFLNQFFAEMDSAILQRELLMSQESPNFKFDRAIYYEKAALIRNELETLDQKWDEFMANNDAKLSVNGHKGEFDLKNSRFYLKSISVNAYRSKIDSAHYRLQFENYHFDAVSIKGYSIKGAKDSLILFDEPIVLQGFIGGRAVDSVSIILNQKPSRFFFELNNLPGTVKTKKFIKWERATGEHPRIALHNAFSINSPYYTVNKDELTFKKGAYEIDELVYIPAGYRVNFQAGTTIDFVRKGGLIINDHTEMRGTELEPIKFNSSDTTGMGITILQAGSVFIDHVEVANMDCLNYEGWVLTGALTIYESEVSINHLHIRNNVCEDGLNIIRSHFKVENCLIESTKSDGFDADFCAGKFLNSTFKNTGNDCIDFSGSQVEIVGIEITNSGDKGVSAGERSSLVLRDITINGALTGLASKDGSIINGTNIEVSNAEVGLATFQKKPEYTGSAMVLGIVHFNKLNRLSLIEEGSSVTVDGKVYRGYQKFDIERMYARFPEK